MKVLADTSLWISFLSGKGNKRLSDLLRQDSSILIHPWVIGELMIGNLGKRREEILNLLLALPQTPAFTISDLMPFIEKEELYGIGLSFVDIQLLYTALATDTFLWTDDKKLKEAALKYHRDFQEDKYFLH